MKRRIAVVLSLLCLFLTSCTGTAEPPDGPQPVETEKHGFDDGGVLYVCIEGKTYRYQRYAPGDSGLTRDERVDGFDENLEWETICWDIYTVKEYPDRSYLLVRSGTNSEWIFRWGDDLVALCQTAYMGVEEVEQHLEGRTREEVHALFGTPHVTETAPDRDIYTNFSYISSLVITYADVGTVEKVERREYSDLKFFVLRAPVEKLTEHDNSIGIRPSQSPYFLPDQFVRVFLPDGLTTKDFTVGEWVTVVCTGEASWDMPILEADRILLVEKYIETK